MIEEKFGLQYEDDYGSNDGEIYDETERYIQPVTLQPSSSSQKQIWQPSVPVTAKERNQEAVIKKPRKAGNFTAMGSSNAAEISHRKLGTTVLTPELKEPDPGQRKYMKVTAMQGILPLTYRGTCTALAMKNYVNPFPAVAATRVGFYTK